MALTEFCHVNPHLSKIIQKFLVMINAILFLDKNQRFDVGSPLGSAYAPHGKFRNLKFSKTKTNLS